MLKMGKIEKMVKMQKYIKTDWFILAAQLYPDLKGFSLLHSKKRRWLKLHLWRIWISPTWYSKRLPHTTKLHENISAESFAKSFREKCL